MGVIIAFTDSVFLCCFLQIEFFFRALVLRMRIDRSCWLPSKQGIFGRLDGGIINFYYYFHQNLSLTFVGHLPISETIWGSWPISRHCILAANLWGEHYRYYQSYLRDKDTEVLKTKTLSQGHVLVPVGARYWAQSCLPCLKRGIWKRCAGLWGGQLLPVHTCSLLPDLLVSSFSLMLV